MRRKGKTGYYDVDQSNLISRIKEDLFEIILNPTKENVHCYMKNFIKKKCIHSPKKVKEPKKYTRKKKLFKPKFTTNYKLNF